MAEREGDADLFMENDEEFIENNTNNNNSDEEMDSPRSIDSSSPPFSSHQRPQSFKERNRRMERTLQHFNHKHLLILKAEERKIDDGTNHSDMDIETCKGCSKHVMGPFYRCGVCRFDGKKKIRKCEGCQIPISGPFYGCEECGYFLHKVCAELPNEMNHPGHPDHTLTLLAWHPHATPCAVCNNYCSGFVYHCFTCWFYVDLVCASICHGIKDECHKHPLTPIQTSIPFPCHICLTENKGLSYKCNECPFWVHQNCTVSLPSTIDYSHHHGHDDLKLWPSVPLVYENFITKCDICQDKLFKFHCIYYCDRCSFCAHVNCARSKEALESSRSSVASWMFDQDGQRLAVLPVQQQSTDLISWFAENYRDGDRFKNFRLDECGDIYIGLDSDRGEEIKYLDDKWHPVLLIDDQVSEKICDACAQPISTPLYGCIKCDYFLHKCCTELPEKFLRPVDPRHQFCLSDCDEFSLCRFCWQWCNGFVYRSSQRDQAFCIDIKCASLLRPVIHEAHRHPLIPGFKELEGCSACNETISYCGLKCDTCSFNLCFRCAMAPPIMTHRYDKHPFKLAYFPPEKLHYEYICELCLKALVPKLWHYHCGECDQFTHVKCMIEYGADSNIKYGKTYKSKNHEHKLTLVPCTYDCSFCSSCHLPLRTGFRVGLKCRLCDFGLHLKCSSLLSIDKEQMYPLVFQPPSRFYLVKR